MLLEWWNDIVSWSTSLSGQRVLISTIYPFLAIVAGAIIASLIARGAVRRLIDQRDAELKATAIAAVIASARRASVWNSLTAPEKDHVERQTSEAEVHVRLLPIPGSSLAADWSAHLIARMKKNSTNYGFQAEQDLSDLQDGLIEWQDKPSRARKLFSQDLAAWKYDAANAEDELVTKQREWAAQQNAATVTEPVSSAS